VRYRIVGVVPKSPLVKQFGSRVRELRLRRGWSQEDLADRAKLHRNAVSLIERGDRSSTLETIEKLCKAFLLQPADLMPEIESVKAALLRQKR
jgi:XRE family transcriptional regulator, regulator of sulfur utilization